MPKRYFNWSLSIIFAFIVSFCLTGIVFADVPTVAITTPANNTILGSSLITIVLNVSSANLNYTNISLMNSTGGVRNSTTNTTNGIYSISLSAPADGSYKINATTHSLDNNVTTAIISNVTVDTSNPLVTINVPLSNASLSSKAISINVTVTDATLNYTNLSVINSTGAIVNSTAEISNGTYVVELSVPSDGVYNITITAHDALEHLNETTASNITVDSVAPSLVINLPATNATSTSKTLTINLTVDETNLNYTNISIINSTGSVVNSTRNSSSGNYAISLNVPIDGVYNITALTYDLANNNHSTTNSNITVDTVNPTIAINSPAENALISSRVVPINLTVNDTNLVYANITLVNSLGSSVNYTLNSTKGTYVINLTATADGVYNITAVAYDVAGRTNSTTVSNITLDGTNPTVTLTLSDISPVKEGNVTFSLDFSKPMNQSINATIQIINSSTHNITSIGWVNSTRWQSWFNFTNSTGDGIYTVNLTGAKDLTGHSMIQDVSNSLLLDTILPTLVVNSPSADSTSESMTATVSLTVNDTNLDNTTVVAMDSWGAVAASGSSATNGNSSITLSIPVEGRYDIVAITYDLAGNNATQTVANVTFEQSGSSSGSGSGHSSSGGSSYSNYETSFWQDAPVVGSADFVQGVDTTLAKSYRVKVKVGSDDHYVGVVAITENSATINISSDPQQVNLSVGQDTRVEVNNDGYYDIYLKLNSIKDGVTNLTIKGIYELVTVAPKEDSLPTNSGAVIPPKEQTPVETQTPPTVSCTEGVRKCVGNNIERCVNGEWISEELCALGCNDSGVECIKPPENNPKDQQFSFAIIALSIIVIIAVAALLFLRQKEEKNEKKR